MSDVTIYDNEFITVKYIPDKGMIYHTVHKPLADQGTMFQDALNAGTEALKKYKCTKWLSDDRKNGPLPPEQIEWGATDWNPRTIEAGWKYWANIVPEEIAAAGTLMPVIQNLHTFGLRMQVFTNLEDALKWLENISD